MADKEAKESVDPLKVFRQKLRGTQDIKDIVIDGLKSTNAKVRSLAIKVATRSQDHAFVKKHVLPLIKSEKSKKVLRTLADKTYRKELAERVKAMTKVIVAGKKAAPAADGGGVTPEPAPEAKGA